MYHAEYVFAIVKCPVHGEESFALSKSGLDSEKDEIDREINEDQAFCSYLRLLAHFVNKKGQVYCRRCSLGNEKSLLKIMAPPDYIKEKLRNLLEEES